MNMKKKYFLYFPKHTEIGLKNCIFYTEILTVMNNIHNAFKYKELKSFFKFKDKEIASYNSYK